MESMTKSSLLKKIGLSTLTTFFALGLTACGTDEATPASNTAAPSTEQAMVSDEAMTESPDVAQGVTDSARVQMEALVVQASAMKDEKVEELTEMAEEMKDDKIEEVKDELESRISDLLN